LKEWNKNDIDSVGFVSMTNDSSYIFPLTNYQSSLLETRTAGDNSQVSEVVKQGNIKFLYRLRVDENTLRRRNVTAQPTEYMKSQMDQERLKVERIEQIELQRSGDSTKTDSTKATDFFENGFDNEKQDSSQLGKVVSGEEIAKPEPLIKKARLFEYRPPKYFIDYAVTGFNNQVFGTRYQPYSGGSGPIELSNGGDFNGILRMGTSDLFEDVKFMGGFRLSTSNLSDYDVLFSFMNYKRRLDWGASVYRTNQEVGINNFYGGLLRSNLFSFNMQYAIDRVRSFRAQIGPRFDKIIVKGEDQVSLETPDITKIYSQVDLQYVYDNTLNPVLNIWKGLRYKIYFDWYTQLSNNSGQEGKFLMNAGFDIRNYLSIYRNIIWAVRGAGDFSWGSQKVIYYLGGVDGWIDPKFNNANTPAPDVNYTYQSLSLNMRGFPQNVANGNNAIVLNSEVRAPVFSTFFNKPINNAFIRNFQLVQFIDLGTAWNGQFNKIERPSVIYGSTPLTVRVKAGGVGPFVGGYGFGARSTLLGYFLRFDCAWQMNGFLRGKPELYVALGMDF
jgi:hypothetical protein